MATTCNNNEEIVVLGAGYSGLTTGALLAQQGFKVRLVAQSFGMMPPITFSGPQSHNWPGIGKATGTFNAHDLLAKEFKSLPFFLNLCDEPDSGVSAVPAYKISKREGIKWLNEVHLDLDPDEKKARDDMQARLKEKSKVADDPDIEQKLRVGGYKSIDKMYIIKVESQPYFKHLSRTIVKHSGRVCMGQTISPEDVESIKCRALFNCLGMGAKKVDAGVTGDLLENSGEELIFAPPSKPLPYIHDEDTHGVIGGVLDDGRLTFQSGLAPNLKGDYDLATSALTIEHNSGAMMAILGENVSIDDVQEFWSTNRPTRPQGFNIGCRYRADGQLVVDNNGHAGAGVSASWGCADLAVELLKKELV